MNGMIEALVEKLLTEKRLLKKRMEFVHNVNEFHEIITRITEIDSSISVYIDLVHPLKG